MQNIQVALWVFGGPNGAGKSTIVAKYLRQRLPIVNPDVIAAEINQDHSSPPAIIKAGKVAVRLRAKFSLMGNRSLLKPL